MYQLARERIDLQAKLGELQALVVKLLGERSMLHTYQKVSPAASPAISPSVPPPPTKRHRHRKHSHHTDADGTSNV